MRIVSRRAINPLPHLHLNIGAYMVFSICNVSEPDVLRERWKWASQDIAKCDCLKCIDALRRIDKNEAVK